MDDFHRCRYMVLDVRWWCCFVCFGHVLPVETFYFYNFCFYLLFIVLLFVSMIEISWNCFEYCWVVSFVSISCLVGARGLGIISGWLVVQLESWECLDDVAVWLSWVLLILAVLIVNEIDMFRGFFAMVLCYAFVYCVWI